MYDRVENKLFVHFFSLSGKVVFYVRRKSEATHKNILRQL